MRLTSCTELSLTVNMSRWHGVVRFAGQIISSYRERRRWVHCIPTCISAQITDAFLYGIFLGIKDGSEEFVSGTPAGCVVCKNCQATAPQLFSTAFGGNTREPRELREQPLRIDVRPVHAGLPPPISAEPSKPHRVHIRNSVELAR